MRPSSPGMIPPQWWVTILSPGWPVEHAGEHQARDARAGLVWPAHHLPDLVHRAVLARVVGELGGPRGVQEDGQAAARQGGEQGLELRAVQRPAIHVGVDLHAARAEVVDGVVQLGHGRLHVVQGHGGGEGGEGVGVAADQLGQPLVDEAGQGRPVLRTAELLRAGGWRRQHLLVALPPAHEPQARLQVEQHGDGPDALGQPRLRLQRLVLLQVPGRHEVGVDVDDAFAHGLCSPARRLRTGTARRRWSWWSAAAR